MVEPLAAHEMLSGKSTLPSIINKSSTSTLTIGIDIKSKVLFEDIAIQFFNGFVHSIVSSGSVCSRGSVLVTAQQPFMEQSGMVLQCVHLVRCYVVARII